MPEKIILKKDDAFNIYDTRLQTAFFDEALTFDNIFQYVNSSSFFKKLRDQLDEALDKNYSFDKLIPIIVQNSDGLNDQDFVFRYLTLSKK